MATPNTVIVGFTRADGIFTHIQVPEGWTVSQLLKKKGYAETELASLSDNLRINNNNVDDVLNAVLKKDDVLMLMPAVKGA